MLKVLLLIGPIRFVFRNLDSSKVLQFLEEIPILFSNSERSDFRESAPSVVLVDEFIPLAVQ